MRLHVSEFCCAARAAAVEDSLLAEGRAMLTALLDDLARLPDVVLSTAWNERLGSFPVASADGRSIELHTDESVLAGSNRPDAAIVIAPETDGILADRCRRFRAAGVHLIGPSSACLELCADKLATSRRLEAAGVAVVPTRLLHEPLPAEWCFPLVVKPRDGAGASETRIVRTESDFTRERRRLSERGGRFIVQPYEVGRALSVAAVVSHDSDSAANTALPSRHSGVTVLPLVEQLLSSGDELHYLGGRFRPAGAVRGAAPLVQRVLQAVGADAGWLGIDLILPAAASADSAGGAIDLRRAVVVEVNPRLTTSYVLYRAAATCNLSALLVAQPSARQPNWRAGVFECDKRGRIQRRPA